MPPPGPYRLIIEDDEGNRRVVPVTDGEMRIGRGEDSTICLAERNISREHARLSLEGGALFAEDLNSFNGLWLNGQRVEGRRPLSAGDVLKIGDFQIELRATGPGGEDTDAGNTQPGRHDTHPGFSRGQGAAPLAADEPTQTLARAPQAAPAPEVAAVSEQSPAAVGPPPAAVPPPLSPPAAAADPEVLPAALRSSLLCVSTAFAGQRFEVGRSEVVIGRVAHNDIGIDHRSVSRHHAKLVTAARRFVIVDLHSANGLFVNGEPYAQTELKRGDLIELGHVRLRFIPPGDTYAPTAAEQAAIRRAQRPAGGLRRRLLQAAAFLAALGVVAGAVLVALHLTNSEAPPEEAAEGPAPRPPPASAAAAPQEVATLLAQTQAALEQKQPRRAQIFLGAALALEPARAEAHGLQRRLEQALHDERSLAGGRRAEDQHNLGEAWAALEEIGGDSVFAGDAGEARARIRPALAAERLRACRTALGADDFAEAQARLDAAAQVDPGHHDLPELRAQIEDGRRRGAGHHPSRPAAAAGAAARPAHPPRPPLPSPAPPPAGDEPGPLYTEGLRAFHAGQVKAAIDLFGRCAGGEAKDRSQGICLRALGILYAKQGDGPRAVHYYRLYLKAEPNSPDAPQVQDLLRQYEKAH